MLSWLYIFPINTGESKKTHKRKYRREKFCRVQEETILFFDIYKKAYYHDLTIIMKDCTFDIPFISIISLSNKE